MSFKVQNSHLIWPEQLEVIGVSEEQRDCIDKVLNLFIEMSMAEENVSADIVKYKIQGDSIKKFRLINEDNGDIEEFKIPFSLDLRSEDGKIVLITKKMIAEGGQRTVKVAFDLKNGEMLAKKRLVSKNELIIYRHLQDNPCRGLPNGSFIREIGDKFQVFEPRFDESLHSFLGHPRLDDYDVKLSLLRDLSAGLCTLHALPLSDEDGAYFCYHGDVKALNILVKNLDGDDPEAVWTDFGFSGKIKSLGGTSCFKAPDYVAEVQRMRKGNYLKSDVIRYNKRFGFTKDMWGMGLIAFYILQNKSINNQFPLRTLQIALNKPTRTDTDEHVEHLNQFKLNRELTKVKAKSDDPRHIKIVDFISSLLRVKAEERINSKQAFHMLNS